VAFFSDAIFAIAMTLLVVGLDPPEIADQVLRRARFWLAHHRYVGRLGGVDRRTTSVILVYLALIAFVPFPSAMLGQYSNNSVAVAV
jgi:uncharacterized membrane protein